MARIFASFGNTNFVVGYKREEEEKAKATRLSYHENPPKEEHGRGSWCFGRTAHMTYSSSLFFSLNADTPFSV
jgi:hypothetical protein